MSASDICRAVKRDGQRCSNKAKIAGFCAIHFPARDEEAGKKLRERLTTAGQVIAMAGGAMKLIEEIVKLWQSLPFGPGPRMPADYEYLADQVGPFYPQLPDKYSPFSKGAASVNWQVARALYDRASAVAAEESTPGATATSEAASMEVSIDTLLDAMQPEFLALVLRKLGEQGNTGEDGVA